MSRVAFTCLLKQKLKFCSSLTHIFDEKKVSIFFKNKPVWRIFSPGFMFSEMNLWKFGHYFWQFRHYFWKLDFSSTLMLKLMETLFFKLLCRTPADLKEYERVGCTKFLGKSSIFLANFWNFFHILLRSQCTFGTKNPKNSITGTLSKMVLFQKTWWKRVKEYSFNLSAEIGIVEDGVAVILPPGLTL